MKGKMVKEEGGRRLASFLGILRSSLYYLAAFLPSSPPSLLSLLRRGAVIKEGLLSSWLPFIISSLHGELFVLHAFFSFFNPYRI